jgi:ABC-2 type transport system permease protein
MALRRWMRILPVQVQAEWLKLVRMRLYLVLLLVVPVALYSVTAVNPRAPDQEGIPARVYLIASFGTFGLFGTALFGFGLGTALERGQGWTRALSAAPVSPLMPLAAKLVVCMAMSGLSLAILLVAGALFFDVGLPVATILLLYAVMLLCSIPIGSVGLALGAWLGPNSAPVVMILVYLFVSSFSGIVVPLEMIARGNLSLVQFTPLFPTFHAGQLALAVLRPPYDTSFLPLHIIALIAFTIGSVVLAHWGSRRNASQQFG